MENYILLVMLFHDRCEQQVSILPANKRTGMHAFRHGLATRMLENDVSLPVISQTLGHADISSTEVYLRISIKSNLPCVDWRWTYEEKEQLDLLMDRICSHVGFVCKAKAGTRI